MPIGFAPFEWVEDAAGAVSDAATSLWDVADDIPGVAEFGSGFRALVTGPLREAANSAAGQIVLRALASSTYGGIVSVVGPMFGAQLASAAFAIPGLARGEDFWTAWFQESWYRAKETAEIVGPGVGDEVVQATGVMKELGKRIPNAANLLPEELLSEVRKQLQMSGVIDIESLAKRLKMPESVAAMVLAALTGDASIYRARDYDAAGKKKPTRTLSKVRVGPPPVGQQTMSKGVASALDKLFAQAAAQEQAEAAALAVANEAAAARAETAGSVALVGVVTAGALAGAWWYFRKR